MRVGFIGLGSQGAPWHGASSRAAMRRRCGARRATSLEPYADTAAKTAGSPAELAAGQ